ncbi:MAG TPA: hypothetical protein VIL88_02595 [Devosia sp.]|uniref:hypothetical protein n=1 Tax=Devosia sp. TaxID=1871048 RepID=UPI002F9561CF
MRIVGAIAIWGCLASSCHAANFTQIKGWQSGAWNSALFENNSNGQRFCALESEGRSPVFRLNSYLADGDTFIELFDPNWSKMEGAVTFSLAFDTMDRGPISIELRGRSWGDSYTYDILEKANFDLLQGLLSASTSMQALNSNGATLATFSLDGAATAVRTFNECLRSR